MLFSVKTHFRELKNTFMRTRLGTECGTIFDEKSHASKTHCTQTDGKARLSISFPSIFFCFYWIGFFFIMCTNLTGAHIFFTAFSSSIKRPSFYICIDCGLLRKKTSNAFKPLSITKFRFKYIHTVKIEQGKKLSLIRREKKAANIVVYLDVGNRIF